MKKTLIILFPFLYLLILPLHLTGDGLTKVGSIGAKFLDIGIGSRPVSMGEAFTAVADDAASFYWNPAALTKIEGKDFFISDVEWIADIRLIACAYCQKFSFGNLGLFVELLDSGEMLETTESFFDGTGKKFRFQAYQAGIGYAKMLTDKFSFGFNLKGIREDYTYVKVNNFAFDVGTLYDTGWKTLRLGMAMQNFGPEMSPLGTYKIWQGGTNIDPSTGEEMINEFEPYSMPLLFRIGFAMDFVTLPNQLLTAAFDIVHPPDNNERYNIGMEYSFLKILFIRGGYGINRDEGGLSTGCGFNYCVKNTLVKLDYAFADFGRLPDIHRVSVGCGF